MQFNKPTTEPHLGDHVDDVTVLVVAVTYESPDAARAFIEDIAADPGDGGVRIVLAVNSPTVNPALRAAARSAGIRLEHFPSNPAYSGAARQVLSALVAELDGPLEYDAVVLSNVDIEFSCAKLTEVVAAARAHTGDCRWVLAPDIVEPNRKYRVNPQSMRRPEQHNGRFRHTLRRRFAMFDHAYRWFWRQHRKRATNANADLPPFSRIYSAGGAFTIFGKGYFLEGGVFQEGPLFSEEYGFAEQAHHLDVPVLYTPQMIVRHESEVTTSAKRRGHDQRHQWYLRADRFYRAWRPEYVVGSMTEWFTTDTSLPSGDSDRTAVRRPDDGSVHPPDSDSCAWTTSPAGLRSSPAATAASASNSPSSSGPADEPLAVVKRPALDRAAVELTEVGTRTRHELDVREPRR